MNILFVTENEISQQLGGTDRITITLPMLKRVGFIWEWLYLCTVITTGQRNDGDE